MGERWLVKKAHCHRPATQEEVFADYLLQHHQPLTLNGDQIEFGIAENILQQSDIFLTGEMHGGSCERGRGGLRRGVGVTISGYASWSPLLFGGASLQYWATP